MTDNTATGRHQNRPHEPFPRTAASSSRWLGGILVAALSSGCASQSFEDCSTQPCAPSHVIARDGSWTRAAAPSRNRAWLSGLTADPAGNFVLGFWEGTPLARRYSAGGWSSATQVSCEGCFDHVLTGNTRGDALALAIDRDGRTFARQYRQGTWQVDGTDVAGLDGYLPQALVTAAMAPNGEAHVLLVDDKVMRRRQTNTGGVWSDGQSIPIPDTTYFQPVIAFDSQGEGFATWVAHREDDDRSGIHFIRFQGGSVSSVQSIPGSWESNHSLGQVALAVASDGDAAAVWPGPGGLFVSNYTAEAWSAATAFRTGEKSIVCGSPTLLNDGTDFVVAWGESSGDVGAPCLVYSSRWHDTTWSKPELRSDTSGSSDEPPLLAADQHGNVLLVWTKDDRASFARFDHSTGTWTAAAGAFEAAFGARRALAVAGNGTAMLAYETEDRIEAALFE
jgi:hypothetical protein